MGLGMMTDDGRRTTVEQLGLDLGLGAVPSEARLFWCCGDCWEVHEGKVSLTWLPPDQQVGECWTCRRRYVFGSRYGWEELAERTGVERV